MLRLEFPTIIFQVMDVQAVLEAVKFNEPAFAERNAEMLTAQVPDAFNLEGIIQIEPSNFFR